MLCSELHNKSKASPQQDHEALLKAKYRPRITLDFDREYLWDGSSNRQAENYDFFPRSMKTFDELWSANEKK